VVIEATIEEKISKINKVIQGFHNRVGELEAHTTPSTPPEKKERRDITSITSVADIKSLSEECARLCEERTWI
jgi:hypothetical protein